MANSIDRGRLAEGLIGVQVSKSAATLPATTTQNIFTVTIGRVLVLLLLGEVTTIVQAQPNNLKVTSAPTTGTAVDIASILDVNAKEAGTLLLCELDGTALVGANAGAGLGQIVRAGHRVAGIAQIADPQFASRRVVFDHEYGAVHVTTPFYASQTAA